MLNEHQRRRVEVSLGLFDRALLEIERNYLSADLPQGEMFAVSSDLSAEERAQIRTMIAQVRDRLRVLREIFHLTPYRKDARSLLRGYFSHFWAVLSDCRASALRGYGTVAPELSRTLDPEIEAILVLLERLECLLERRTVSSEKRAGSSDQASQQEGRRGGESSDEDSL